MNSEANKTDFIPAEMEKWVNLSDVAEHLSVSQDTVRAWIRDEKIPYCRAGKQYKFLLSEVNTALREGKLV
ncbi:MAG TPA: helix-turn-helix domain-containing protein [Spirochaetota bacterium]|nr:helix-turn-helix domain-containing protein [Spirochaetota bacterium]